jgi:hypothetical protein
MMERIVDEPPRGVWACPIHGRLPLGAGFRCAICADMRPRETPCVVECWTGCGMLRGMRRREMGSQRYRVLVRACERCGDGAYPFDV